MQEALPDTVQYMYRAWDSREQQDLAQQSHSWSELLQSHYDLRFNSTPLYPRKQLYKGTARPS